MTLIQGTRQMSKSIQARASSSFLAVGKHCSRESNPSIVSSLDVLTSSQSRTFHSEHAGYSPLDPTDVYDAHLFGYRVIVPKAALPNRPFSTAMHQYDEDYDEYNLHMSARTATNITCLTHGKSSLADPILFCSSREVRAILAAQRDWDCELKKENGLYLDMDELDSDDPYVSDFESLEEDWTMKNTTVPDEIIDDGCLVD